VTQPPAPRTAPQYVEPPASKSGSSAAAPLSGILGFTGEYKDSVGGMYALGNGYRFYHPALMRFMAPDDLSPFGEAGPNPYAYCAGDPINYRDPSGHIQLRLFDSALGDLVSSIKGMTSKKGIEVPEVDEGRLPIKEGHKPLLGAHPQEELGRRPLPNTGPYQRPVHPDAMFNLVPAPDAQIDERRFVVRSSNKNQVHEVTPEGRYIYVIPFENPTEIRLAQLPKDGYPTDELGHTSLMQKWDHVKQGLYKADDVLYAGQMEFANGALIEWDNVSGHYQPPGDLGFVRANVPVKWQLLLGMENLVPFTGWRTPNPRLG
jgi:RHS repeat-associated protein